MSEPNSLTSLARYHYSNVDRLGWHDRLPLEAVALIHEELGEVSREFRAKTPDLQRVQNELGDVILRCLDLAYSVSLIELAPFRTFDIMYRKTCELEAQADNPRKVK